MKRDCGEGELIPYRYEIVLSPSMDDREIKIPATGVDDPKFDEILSKLGPYGNVRLYVKDKQGYANCIRYVFVKKDGEVCIAKDRRTEIT